MGELSERSEQRRSLPLTLNCGAIPMYPFRRVSNFRH
jgi:hypothetical protein